MTTMNIKPTDISVLDLLPQRPPFIMVDKLTYFDAKSAKTIFTVCEDNMFCFDGRMEESGLVENIAQTCAARTGFKQRLESFGDAAQRQDAVVTMPDTWDAAQRPDTGDAAKWQEAGNSPFEGGQGDVKKGQEDVKKGQWDVKKDQRDAKNIKIGMIIMIQSLEIKRRPVVGEILETSMMIEEEFFSTTFVRSEVKIGDEIIAACRMKLFLTDKVPDKNE